MAVAIRKLAVPRYMQKIAQGQSVFVLAEIINTTLSSVLLDPNNIPLFTLYDPAGVKIVNDSVMERQSTGYYSYTYPTTIDTALGLYTGSVKAVHNSDVAVLPTMLLFKVIEALAVTTFTYLSIKDQEGNVWYWYVNSDETLTTSLTIPVVLGKRAVAISGAIPYWLAINNNLMELRYVYPALDGSPRVESSAPLIGSGYTGSPTFIGVNTDSYVLALNDSDEITPVAV